MKEIDQILESMEPADALAAVGPLLNKVLAHLDEESRIRFVTSLLEKPDGDNIASMVNL